MAPISKQPNLDQDDQSHLQLEVEKCQQNQALPINIETDRLHQGQLRLKSRHTPTRTATNMASYMPEDYWMGDWSMNFRNAGLVEDPVVNLDGFSLPSS